MYKYLNILGQSGGSSSAVTLNKTQETNLPSALGATSLTNGEDDEVNTSAESQSNMSDRVDEARSMDEDEEEEREHTIADY